MITGIDIVQEQLRIANGQPLSYRQEDVAIRGHAIECRVNAEDPVRFMPSPGEITRLHIPGGPGIRVDSHIYQGYRVPPHYDSLIGKLIAHGDDRDAALARMRQALHEMVIAGIQSNTPLHQRILDDAGFQAGGVNIHYLQEQLVG
jgi:acetyl-CoA carboxylase biotin carboxylase subunit